MTIRTLTIYCQEKMRQKPSRGCEKYWGVSLVAHLTLPGRPMSNSNHGKYLVSDENSHALTFFLLVPNLSPHWLLFSHLAALELLTKFQAMYVGIDEAIPETVSLASQLHTSRALIWDTNSSGPPRFPGTHSMSSHPRDETDQKSRRFRHRGRWSLLYPHNYKNNVP